jgi:hypothetical protein
MFPHIKDDLLERIKPIHRKFRAQKMELFLRIAGDSASQFRLLDVGGGPGVDGEFLDLYSRFAEVVVVNLDPEAFEAGPAVHFQSMFADGRFLPFGSASFEWVFSNAVIEHVGGWEDQLRFAQEIRRVASRGYFVTTPNRYFPLESHTLLPFYQFLPVSLQRRVAPYSPGYLRQYEEINLLSSAQMRKLFPEAKVVPIGFPMFGNSLVAHYRKA